MTLKKMNLRLELWSASLGNFFEHYDTALFSFLSVFLAPLIFPHCDPLTALIYTYAIIPLGMLTRPLGAIFFGRIGDRLGRRKALFLSLASMGVVSLLMAVIPTYRQAGIFAPIAFFLARILQNFLSAGELAGGAIFLLENAPHKKSDMLSSLYNLSTIGGILLASAAVSGLCLIGSIEKSWRWLYVGGFVTTLFGCFLRRHIAEEVIHRDKEKLLGVLWQYKRELCLIAVIAGISYANYSMAFTLPNALVPLISSISKEKMMQLNTGFLVLDFLILPLFGWLATKISREKLMIASTFAVVIMAMPCIKLLQEGTMLSIILVRTIFIFIGVALCAPYYAWAQDLVPAKCRYTVISLGYALGCQVLGAPTATIALWCFKTTHIVSSVAWYWIGLNVMGGVVLKFAARSKRFAELR